MNQKSGFTLIELVLVIIILAILAAAAHKICQFKSYRYFKF